LFDLSKQKLRNAKRQRPQPLIDCQWNCVERVASKLND